MYTIVVVFLLLSDPRFDNTKLELLADDPAAFRLNFPLENDLCHHTKK